MANGSNSFLGGVTAGYRVRFLPFCLPVRRRPSFRSQLRDGQTVFARAIFEDALSKQKLSYSFDSPVTEIIDQNGTVKVVTTKGTFEASKVICTTPLNVTNQIKFSPPVSAVRAEAFKVGSVAFAHKIHVVMSKPELRGKAWSAYDSKDLTGFSSALGIDYTKDKKSSILVAFGSSLSLSFPSFDL
jgi:monoamine oxidase